MGVNIMATDTTQPGGKHHYGNGLLTGPQPGYSRPLLLRHHTNFHGNGRVRKYKNRYAKDFCD